jgi:hypothetical protein
MSKPIKLKLEPVEKVPEELLKRAVPQTHFGIEVARQLMAIPSKVAKIGEEELMSVYQGKRLRLDGKGIREITGGRRVRYIYDPQSKEYYFWVE